MFWLLSVIWLTGCSIAPEPLHVHNHMQRAIQDKKAIFAKSSAAKKMVIGLPEAMARSIKYNLDHKLKVMESALSLGQANLSRYDLLPKLALAAGYSRRGKQTGAFSRSLSTGLDSATASTSTEEEQTSSSLNVSWNVLDFGVSYLHAKQQTDRFLVAKEQKRKVVHNIIQEVRQAYWRALTAQELMPVIDKFLADASQALTDSQQAEQRLLTPPMEALNYQMTMLDTIYQITTLQRELAVAKTQLAALMNLDPNSQYTLLAPAKADWVPPRISYDVELIEQMALSFRPELRQEDYQKRIDARETEKALLQLLPGLEFSSRYSVESNRFLFQQQWAEGGVRLAWNLLKQFASQKDLEAVADTRMEVGLTRRLALSMAVLTQVRVARLRYGQTLAEYDLVQKMADTAERINKRMAAATAAQTGLAQIESRSRAIFRKLQLSLAFAEVQSAAGRLYLSMGMDPLPVSVESHDLDQLANVLAQAIKRWNAGEIELGEIVLPGRGRNS